MSHGKKKKKSPAKPGKGKSGGRMSLSWTCAVFRFILYKTERSPRDFSSEGNRSCSWKPKLAAVHRRTTGGVRTSKTGRRYRVRRQGGRQGLRAAWLCRSTRRRRHEEVSTAHVGGGCCSIVRRPWRDVRKGITRRVGGTWCVQYTCVIDFSAI